MNTPPTKRALISALFLILSACSSHKSSWSSGKIASSSAFECRQLVFPPENRFRNLEVVFQKDNDQIKIYLNVYSVPFEATQNQVNLTLTVDLERTIFEVPVLAGGQRLALSDEAKTLLLNALFAKKEIVIEVGRYETIIHSNDFEKEFDKFNIH